MNSHVLLIYLAAGSFAKLITIKHPTPGEKWTAGIEIAAVGCLLSLLIPASANNLADILILLPYGMSVLGSLLAEGIDKFRLWWDAQ